MKRTPSLGDPQFGKTHEDMLEMILLADSIIKDAEFEVRKSGTLDKIRDWKKKKTQLDSRLRK